MPVTSTSPLPSSVAPGAPRTSSCSFIVDPKDNRRVIADIGGRRFEWGSRTYVMGIVNTTPDSFSGDGVDLDRDAALRIAEQQVGDGDDIIDVGGESTRPGAGPVTESEELRRVVPVIELLARRISVPISID